MSEEIAVNIGYIFSNHKRRNEDIYIYIYIYIYIHEDRQTLWNADDQQFGFEVLLGG